MFWIVSNTVCKSSESELKHRYDYIKEVTNTKVSPWRTIVCQSNSLLGVRKNISFFQCKSEKGEYGFIITAHITEIPYILDTVLSNKRSIIVVNSKTIIATYFATRAMIKRITQRKTASKQCKNGVK